LGRLFDGIAAILDIRYEVSYEGQAAVELEMTAAKSGQTVYPYEYVKEKKAYQIHVYPMIRAVVEDMDRGICVSDISRRFHSTLIHLFADLCGKLRDDTGCNRIVLSGGVFQNVILLSGLESVLKEVGFEVFTHSKIPTNDGGISFGQAAVAAALYHKSGV
jgi:hydrogenase maturation protein HypF